jgi:hypothetical protein
LTIYIPLFCLALNISATASAQLLSGFSLESKHLVGPVQSAISTDPVWIADYHTLVVNYTATGEVKPGVAVLSLRPGSVGPITPRATNPENPLVSGSDIIAIVGRDLVFDGKPHTLRVDLEEKIKTPQIDLLRFVVPTGAKLNIARLEFLGNSSLVPCTAATAVEMPADSQPVAVHGPLSCNGAAATSLRGHESLTLSASGKQGATIYLDLLAHFAGLSNYIPSVPRQRATVTGPNTAATNRFARDSAAIGIPESSDPSTVVANIKYADDPASVEQQFPLLVSQHRHALLNQTRSLYALQLDPKRPLLSVEIADHSPHVQLVLFKAAISSQHETSDDEPALPETSSSMSSTCNVDSAFAGSQWFSIDGTSAASVHAELTKSAVPHGVGLSLALTNNGDADQDVVVSFPSLNIHVSSDPEDVSYLFPEKVANISSRDATLTADYGPNFLLQFTDVFAPKAGCGAAIVVQDSSGLSKTFTLVKLNNAVSDQTEYHIRIASHQTYSLPQVSVILHNGDWRSGFKAYQQWIASWYQPHTPHPAWLQRTFYMRRDYPLGGSDLLFDQTNNRYTFDSLLKEGRAFDGIDFIDISGWGLSDTHGRVGDYPIELGGVQNLRTNIEKAKADHVPTGLYFEGYLIDKNSDVGRAHGLEWQLIGKDGKRLWWPHGSPEMFICPWVPAWQSYLSSRMAEVAGQTGAQAVYLDEFNCGSRRCFATNHGHPVGANMIEGQIQMTQHVRAALDKAGLRSTIVYTECTPVDISAPYVDGTFTYALPSSTPTAYNTKLNLWRFAFPKVQVWDMLSSGVEPHILSAEDFRFAFWHGDGIWLKGRADTWYGEDILAFLRWAHPLLLKHAEAFAGEADPLIESSDPHILVNRFHGGGETVYTLLNGTYETRHFTFHGKDLEFAPRGVQLVAESDK